MENRKPGSDGGSNGNGKAHLHEITQRGAAEPQRGVAPPGGRRIKCPQCGKPAAWEGNPSRPFCSERCRLIDLGQWADGSYAIPAEKVPDKEEE